MGKVIEKVILKNYVDTAKLSEGQIQESAVRTIEVEAFVDTGSAFLCLPPAIIQKLGLLYSRSRQVITANGVVERRIFGGAVISIQGREIQMEVMENDETTPPLVGYLVLENMDFVIDMKAQKLIPNPAHDGKWITDLL
jgi:clan AA aspartic protease